MQGNTDTLKGTSLIVTSFTTRGPQSHFTRVLTIHLVWEWLHIELYKVIKVILFQKIWMYSEGALWEGFWTSNRWFDPVGGGKVEWKGCSTNVMSVWGVEPRPPSMRTWQYTKEKEEAGLNAGRVPGVLYRVSSLLSLVPLLFYWRGTTKQINTKPFLSVCDYNSDQVVILLESFSFGLILSCLNCLFPFDVLSFSVCLSVSALPMCKGHSKRLTGKGLITIMEIWVMFNCHANDHCCHNCHFSRFFVVVAFNAS